MSSRTWMSRPSTFTRRPRDHLAPTILLLLLLSAWLSSAALVPPQPWAYASSLGGKSARDDSSQRRAQCRRFQAPACKTANKHSAMSFKSSLRCLLFPSCDWAAKSRMRRELNSALSCASSLPVHCKSTKHCATSLNSSLHDFRLARPSASPPYPKSMTPKARLVHAARPPLSRALQQHKQHKESRRGELP